MDLRLFAAAIRRRKRLAIGGGLLAIFLALFAYGTPTLGKGGPTIVPRSPAVYQSVTQLVITSASRNYALAGDPSGPAAEKSSPSQLGDPYYLAELSPVYVTIGNGQVVRSAVRAAGVPGTVTAGGDVDPQTGAYIPVLTLTAQAPTPADASLLAKAATAAMQKYVTEQEEGSNAPAAARIELQVTNPGVATLAHGPKFTTPMLVFVAVLTAVALILFSLENKDKRAAIGLGYVEAETGRAQSVPASVPAPAQLLDRLQGRRQFAGDERGAATGTARRE